VILYTVVRQYLRAFLKTDRNRHIAALIIIFLLTIPAFIDTVTPGYFPMHDDLQFIRQIVMDKCFHDGQFPCRWSMEMGYGYGYPIFNFYPPFPYYLGQIFRVVGMSYFTIVKIGIVLNFIVSGLGMYLLASLFWGKRGGIVSALFYVYAPYHAVDIYVRGAINEAWAIAWFPLIFWSLYKLIETRKIYYIPFVALFSGFLMLSHNPMLMIFTPFSLLWVGFWLVYFKAFQTFPKLVISALWGFGLAAFFTVPVLLEQKFAHVETLTIGYFNYLAHFASLNQMFISRFWGYGASELGTVRDGLSFSIGHLHWITSAIAFALAILGYRNKKDRAKILLVCLFFCVTLFYTFLAHERSSFIWKHLTFLHLLQFPWRFLSITIFGTSFLAGGAVFFIGSYIKKELAAKLIVVILLGVIALNFEYFHWNYHMIGVTGSYKLNGKEWNWQITGSIFDYLPIWAKLPPPIPPKADAELLSNNGMVTTSFKNSVLQKYDVIIDKTDTLQINTFYFPGWIYNVNGKEYNLNPNHDSELGRPRIELSPGRYTVEAKFTNTNVRTFANSYSAVAWIVLIGSFFYLKRIKRLAEASSRENKKKRRTA
jgi:hypothetical protein